MRHLLYSLLAIAVLAAPHSVAAQANLISPEIARRHGLVRAWQTRVSVDAARSRVTHITQDVSDWMYIEVKAGDLTYRFSERDRDADGVQIGRTGAAERASAKMADLEASYLKPTSQTFVNAAVTLYLVTDHGVVHCIDGETGETRWTTSVGESRYPTSAVGVGNGMVTVCNGSSVYALDPRDGRELWSRETKYPVNAGPAVGSELIAVPTTKAMEFYVHDQAKHYPPHIYRSQGTIYTQPIATPRSIAWTTEKGHMYVADGVSGKARFRLEASGTFYSRPAYLSPRYFYAASFDGYLYCTDELNGKMLWRYSTGGAITQAPVAVGETVYVVTVEGNLHAVDYKTGQLKTVKYPAQASADATAPAKPQPAQPVVRWPVVSGVNGIIAVSPTRLYCLGRPGQMVIIDANSGGVLGTMPIGSQDIVLHNSVTDRIILGTSMGTLQAFREEELVTPYVHQIELEKQRAKRPEVIIEEGVPADQGDKPMRNDDPFGAPPAKPAEVDPFGAPPAKPAEVDPFGAPAKPANDDPFGAAPKPAPKAPANDPFG